MNSDQLVSLRERIRLALEMGESYYLEFKSCYKGKPSEKVSRNPKEVCQSIAKELVAFANADGGQLLVGVEDDGQITGVPYKPDVQAMLMEAPKRYVMPETPLPIRRQQLVDLDDRMIAYFSVGKGTEFVHQTRDGGIYQRKDRDTVASSVREIQYPREEAISRQYDGLFEESATPADLDRELVAQVAHQVTQIRDMSVEQFLQHMDLAEWDGERLRLKKAALLLFASHVSKWHPRCRVRIMRVRGETEQPAPDYNVTEVADLAGNLFHLLAASWEALRPELSQTRYTEGGLFRTQIIYPEEACREALINAITHRDYSIEGRGIEIRIFDNRLEILSPGKLLSRLTIPALEKLEGLHESRNTHIARVLREFGYILELGEGFRRIFEQMDRHELRKPELSSPNRSFIVTLYHQTKYGPREKLWLEGFKHLNLSPEEKKVVLLGIDGKTLSKEAIQQTTGIVDADGYRELVEGLKAKGIFRTTLSRPNAQREARRHKIPIGQIGRYTIVRPD